MPRDGPLAVKIVLFAGEERAFGPGRADVLAAIDREGSITAAGRSLGMSYRFTWNLVDSMNRCFREKLVDTSAGGKSGGHASLTEAGRDVLAAYRALQAQIMSNTHGEPLETLRNLLQ